VIASLLAQKYAIGDFEAAEIEILSFPKSGNKDGRFPLLKTIPRSRFLSKPELDEAIDDVYRILREIALGG